MPCGKPWVTSVISSRIIEQNAEEVKVSWRSKNGYDVSKLAADFGGGGHKAAAGANISGSMEEVTDAVLKATKELFDE